MDSISRGTTPTITLNINGLSALTPRELWFSFKSKERVITYQFSSPQITWDGDTVSIALTQEDTLNFYAGLLQIQVRILANTGMAYVTPVLRLNVDDVIQDGVIEVSSIYSDEIEP